jgi:hypothetical protein
VAESVHVIARLPISSNSAKAPATPVPIRTTDTTMPPEPIEALGQKLLLGRSLHPAFR